MSPGAAEQSSCRDRKDARLPFSTAKRLTKINEDHHKLTYQLSKRQNPTLFILFPVL